MNRKIHENGIRIAEIDVMCVVGNTKIVIIECKAYSSSIDEDKIKIWKEKIAIIYKWLKNNPDNNEKRIIFDFWSSSGFTKDAEKILLESQQTIKKYSISWKNHESIIDLCRTNKLNAQLEIIRDYF
jgi:Holliday junction resolvase